MAKNAFIISFLVATCLSHSPLARAWDFNADIRKKQEAKDAKRWSLSEWLEQKSRIKLMDSWLAYNKPSPYEFFFSLDTSSLDQEVTDSSSNTVTQQSYRNYRGAFAAFVTVVGLYGEYEMSDEDLAQWKALFMLRLLGNSDQSTNLTLQYGLMNQSFKNSADVLNDETQFQVAGARMNFYLIDAFGLSGLYEHYFKAKSKDFQTEQEGYRYEAGAFIEYGALRLYGSWFDETMETLTNGSTQSTRSRRGILFGARFYF